MPNAGAPAFVDGRYVYLCTPEYMASYARRFIAAGVTVVGGCCGTTPAHIQNLVRSVRMRAAGAARWSTVVPPTRPKEAPAPIPREEKSAARAEASGKKFVVSVELDPPKGADPGRILERAHYCKENEVDAINVADGPRASARMSAQSLVRAHADEGGRRHHPPLHLPRPEPARHPVGPARAPTPWACATSWPSPATRPSSATTRTRPRSTTSTRSASSGSWTT